MGLATILSTLILTVTLAYGVAGFPFFFRQKTLVDPEGKPLEEVSEDVSGRLNRLTAQLQAQEAQITDLGTMLARLTPEAAGFTATSSKREVMGLVENQTLVLDKVLLNMADGYDPSTGVFTAPSTGLYAFSIRVTRHPEDDASCVSMILYKGHNYKVTSAISCLNSRPSVNYNSAVLSLLKGDSIHTQISLSSKILGNGSTSFSGLKL